jgi:peptidoglycan/LPS O-acetylase OafA/YrhL
VVYHLGITWLPGGFQGVDLFFVISGFLITTLLLAEVEGRGRIDLGAFYLRRARRLLPALFLVLAASSCSLPLSHATWRRRRCATCRRRCST